MLINRDRQKLAADLVKYPFRNVLDIGCDFDIPLRQYLPKEINYTGIDFAKSELKEVTECNLENGISLPDKSFDVVFAIEVLEHLENIHFVFEEIMRVAKNEIIIALPNMNHWIYRIKHLFGIKLIEKYTFYPEKHPDRHRWFPTHKASIAFVRHNSNDCKIEMGYGIYPYKRLEFLGKIDTFFSRFFPELFVYTDFFRIDLINDQKKLCRKK